MLPRRQAEMVGTVRSTTIRSLGRSWRSSLFDWTLESEDWTLDVGPGGSGVDVLFFDTETIFIRCILICSTTSV
jgi:hypothetical protein